MTASNITTTGPITCGDAFIPDITNTNNIGTTALRWNNIYASNVNVTGTVSGNGSVLDMSTSTQVVLNNGTSAYINVHGSTSNVGVNCIPTLGYALDVSGQIRASGDITAFSDIRFKTDVQRIPDALSKVQRLCGYTFKRIDEPEISRRYLGVIAQEVLAVVPEAVQGNDATGLSVAYGNLSALLIEAVKELVESVKGLSDRVSAIELRNI